MVYGGSDGGVAWRGDGEGRLDKFDLARISFQNISVPKSKTALEEEREEEGEEKSLIKATHLASTRELSFGHRAATSILLLSQLLRLTG